MYRTVGKKRTVSEFLEEDQNLLHQYNTDENQTSSKRQKKDCHAETAYTMNKIVDEEDFIGFTSSYKDNQEQRFYEQVRVLLSFAYGLMTLV